MPLRSLLGPSEAVLEGLGTPKTLKNQWFFKVSAVVRFRYFGALDVPLGLILAPLGPIWSQAGSQNRSPDCSKSNQDALSWRTRGTGLACRNYLKNSCIQNRSKMAEDGPKRPKITSRETSWVFRSCCCCCCCCWCCCCCCFVLLLLLLRLVLLPLLLLPFFSFPPK